VLNVWKRVESYARDGFTSLIHGKYYHEETRATASQAEKYEGGHYFIVRNLDEAGLVCEFVEGRLGADDLMKRFAHAASPNFDPARDLKRIGVANQTTMLARESLAIGELVGKSMARAHGDEYAGRNFRTFDTICSATQERQDAVVELLREQLDVMVVVGGYNSSNTLSLAALCSETVRTYHVEDADDIDPVSGVIRHRPLGSKSEVEATGWLPASGPLRVGITAGASTPNNKIGEAVGRMSSYYWRVSVRVVTSSTSRNFCFGVIMDMVATDSEPVEVEWTCMVRIPPLTKRRLARVVPTLHLMSAAGSSGAPVTKPR
jgi:4-hydroxy-3-methylbut-2-enyl diphosphate reductase